jgi:S1-C subfamily serine protease
LGTLPLDELKAASIYVKVKAGNIGASGSGFVVRAQGDAVYVVTNHHVIDPHAEPDDTAGQQNPPQNPFPGLPTRPGNPFPNMPGPRFPRPPRFPFGFEPGAGHPKVVQMAALEQGQPDLPQSSAEIWVVLRSGTPQEESLKAVLVADDKTADLALLKATGVKNLPQPIDWKRKPKVRETLPVVAFGFPFGSSLDLKHKNPAITVTKGNVSALRLDGGELSEVQLDLDINPGNSGGPVVDESGALVGVAVAKIKSTRIGFAIPLRKLERLLEANLDKP